MESMYGEDLDIEAIPDDMLIRRLRIAVDTLSLICRICYIQSSCEEAARAHERGAGHADVVDARAHYMTMAPYHVAPFCNLCGKVPSDVDAHLAGKGHRKASQVEAKAWSARFVIVSICGELRRRNLEVPDWCPERLSYARRCRRVTDGGSAKAATAGVAAKAATAGVVDGGLAQETKASSGAARKGLARPGPRASASAGDADRRGVMPEFVRASGAGGATDAGGDGACGTGSVNRELAEISSAMKELARVSSSAVEGLDVLGNKVDLLMIRVLERTKFEGEVLSTMNTMNEKVQSMFERFGTWGTRRVQATVTLSDVADGGQD